MVILRTWFASLTRSAPGGDFGEAGQAPAGADGVAHLLPALAVSFEVAVGEHHPGAGGLLGGEGDLDLAGLGRVGLQLPAQVDVPAEADPVRRVVGEHPGPAALAAVGAPVDDVTAGARLEHHLG